MFPDARSTNASEMPLMGRLETVTAPLIVPSSGADTNSIGGAAINTASNRLVVLFIGVLD